MHTFIVGSIFKRWLHYELRFREQKAFQSLNRVAGYGKIDPENQPVKEAFRHAFYQEG